jgi:hypothetical protein
MSRKRLSQEEFISRANIAHNHKYDYSLTKYTTMWNTVIVICPIHGKFTVEANNHTKNWNNPDNSNRPCGCGACGREFTRQRNKLGTWSQEEALLRFKEVHGDKYDYSDCIYQSYLKKITIGCRIHGKFTQRVGNHLAGSGCPKCKNSRGQSLITNWLSTNSIEHLTEHKFNDCINPKTKYPLKFDVFIPSHNMIIEYDGEQHFKPVKFHQKMTEEQMQHLLDKTQYRDDIKNRYCIENSIKILRIPYTEKKNIANILSKVF